MKKNKKVSKVFKKKHTKKGELRDKWVYYGIKRKPPKPLIDSESDNENKEDF